MTQKTLGYVEMEWTCKRCNTKNPGLQKVCANCGAPMTSEDKFEAPASQELIKDDQKLEKAKAGPDIHCPYCQAPNPAGTAVCNQCGGDLSKGEKREAGKVVGAHTTAPVAKIPCPYCAAEIPANSNRCPKCGGDIISKEKPAAPPAAAQKMPLWMIIAGIALLVLCCGGIGLFAILSAKTSDVTGVVDSVYWRRTIDILEERPAKKEAWEESLPANAQDVSCRDAYRETVSYPVANATEVCGTPYTVDTGSGAGQVVQDCEYRVYDSRCTYTVLEWQVVSQAMAEGHDFYLEWPNLNLTADQRQGDSQEIYQVLFSADGKTYDYSVGDEATFRQFNPGSQWTLSINTFGVLTDVSR